MIDFDEPDLDLDEVDLWQMVYLTKIKNYNKVAWVDSQAKRAFPEYQWVFDRYEIIKKFSNHKVFDLDIEKPSFYPVFVKPKDNELGLGVGARLVTKESDLPKEKGFIAQTYYQGLHLSTDFVVKDSKVIDYFTFIGHKDKDGSFWLWESTDRCNDNSLKAVESLNLKLGVVNVESVGGEIIEMHMRPSPQFHDISGGLLYNLPHFYQTGEWKNVEFEKTYSMVYRTREDYFIHLKKEIPIINGVRSYQKTWIPGKSLSQTEQDEFSFRFLIINGTSLEKIEKFYHKLSNYLLFIKNL